MIPKFSYLTFTKTLILFIFFFQGCSGLQKEPVTKQYFDLSPKIAPPAKNIYIQGEPLLVKEFAISSGFDSHAFVCKIGDHEYIIDYYSEFISYPAKLITEKVSEALFGSALFRPVLTDSKKDVSYRLSGRITRLCGDFSDEKNTKAVMEILMILEKNTDSGFVPVLSHIYPAEAPIPDKTPAALVSGWSRGLTGILQHFFSDLELSHPGGKSRAVNP